MPAHQETNPYPQRREVGDTKLVERLPIVKSFMQKPELEELSSFETRVIEQAIGHFLLKGKIDSAALHTTAQQNIQRRISRGNIHRSDEEGLQENIGKTISNLGKRGLLVHNEEQGTYSLGHELPQARNSLH